jgi:hypothetical protein
MGHPFSARRYANGFPQGKWAWGDEGDYEVGERLKGKGINLTFPPYPFPFHYAQCPMPIYLVIRPM